MRSPPLEPEQPAELPRQSSHSKSRKDFVNLCRALTKWQRKLSEEEVLDRIRHSRVAADNREKFGAAFDESVFLAAVLARSGSR